MYVLLKDASGNMLVRTKVYWEDFILGRQYHDLYVMAEHEDHKALLKMVEIATDTLHDDEKKRKAEADNSLAHVHKTHPIH